jgi:CheY-like chemotaxis protein
VTRILIVDDEPNNQRILKYTLIKAGYETLVAENGQAALALLNEIEADLAIVDFAMPVMDGISLLKRIRAMARYEKLPVIIFTGIDDDAERLIAEQQGIQGFLTKPSSSKTILETVKAVLKNDAKN